jgi:hypothetical protein
LLLGVYGETPSAMMGCGDWRLNFLGEQKLYWVGCDHLRDRKKRQRLITEVAETIASKSTELRGTQAGRRKAAPTFLWLMAIVAWLTPCSAPVLAQNMDKPVLSVDEEVTAFAYALDGRIAYSVRHMYKAKKYDLERDDIFMMDTSGKRKKIFSGEKFSTGDKPLTYLIESFTWSPNSKILAVQMDTITVDIEDGHTEEARALLFIDDSGKELRPEGKGVLLNAENPLWLRDNATIVYFTEEVPPRTLFSMKYENIYSGPGGKAFEGRTFAGAGRISGTNAALAIERDRNMDGPPRLQLLELLAQDDKEVATLDAFAGGLSVSPSGNFVAYYVDNEVLEIREVSAPKRFARLRVGLGVLQWSADEKRIYLKRTVEKKSADLVSFAVPQLAAHEPRTEVPVLEPTPEYLLHGLTVREYGVSPDGRFIGIVLPGKRNLQIFSMH